MTKCTACGSDRVIASSCEERLDVAGVSFTAELSCTRCESCGETFVTSEALGRLELAAAAELAAMGRRTGVALRFMRKALGLRAGELAALLGVAPETFSRWENGEREPDAQTFALVGALAAEQLTGGHRMRDTLRAMREPVLPSTTPRKLPLAS